MAPPSFLICSGVFNQLDVFKSKNYYLLNLQKLITKQKQNKSKYKHVDEYIDIVISQLEYLRPEIVIHRITSDPDPKNLIEPTWLIKKFCVLNDIDKEMKKRNTYQGKKLEEM